MKSDAQKGGRPEARIDIVQLEKLAMIGCTVDETASVLGVSKRTLLRRLNEEECRQAWENGLNRGRVSLRRLQWKLANGSGGSAVSMAIHMSRHRLGETEKSLVELGGKDGGPIPFDFSRLDSLSIEELKVFERVLEKLRPATDHDPASR